MKSKLYKYQWNCDYCTAEEITESTNPVGVLPAGWVLINDSYIIAEDFGEYQKFEVEDKLFCPYCQCSRYFRDLQQNETLKE